MNLKRKIEGGVFYAKTTGVVKEIALKIVSNVNAELEGFMTHFFACKLCRLDNF